MGQRKPRRASNSGCTRFRVGRVSVYFHHNAWWLYYRDNGKPVRQRAAESRDAANQIAAEINAQLTTFAPTRFDFAPVTVATLQQSFLAHHEQVLRSSIATIRRYRTATQHLVDFAGSTLSHELSAMSFTAFLRGRQVSPNGHVHSKKRPLRDTGVQFILETCRAMYTFAQRSRHLPPYAPNPFAELGLDRMRIEDAKEVFVFDEGTEVQFLKASRDWEFPIQFTLAKTGMRSGELCHLLIEDLDLAAGWLHVRNKAELGWSSKTRNERSIPLIDELRLILQAVVGQQASGVVFLRPHSVRDANRLHLCGRKALALELERRCESIEGESGGPVSRERRAKLAQQLWLDAGAFDPDMVRRSYLRIARRCELTVATCPKSWRHTFATLLQDANVDPLLRQITLGHQPSGAAGALGMTSVYTHSRPETQAREIRRAVALWPNTLALAHRWLTARTEGR